MRDEKEAARATQYDLFLMIHHISADPYVHRQIQMTKSKSLEATGFSDQAQAVEEAKKATVAAPINYQDAEGKDHGFAMRQQLLNPAADPWASI